MVVLNLPAFENKYTQLMTVPRVTVRNGEIPTKKEPIRMLGFPSYNNVGYLFYCPPSAIRHPPSAIRHLPSSIYSPGFFPEVSQGWGQLIIFTLGEDSKINVTAWRYYFSPAITTITGAKKSVWRESRIWLKPWAHATKERVHHMLACEQAQVGAQARRLRRAARAKPRVGTSSPDSFPPYRFALRHSRAWL